MITITPTFDAQQAGWTAAYTDALNARLRRVARTVALESCDIQIDRQPHPDVELPQWWWKIRATIDVRRADGGAARARETWWKIPMFLQAANPETAAVCVTESVVRCCELLQEPA